MSKKKKDKDIWEPIPDATPEELAKAVLGGNKKDEGKCPQCNGLL